MTTSFEKFEKKKELIYYMSFSNEELKLIDEMIKQDNFIIDFLWNFIDKQINTLLEKNQKLKFPQKKLTITKKISNICLIIKSYLNKQKTSDKNIKDYRKEILFIFF